MEKKEDEEEKDDTNFQQASAAHRGRGTQSEHLKENCKHQREEKQK